MPRASIAFIKLVNLLEAESLDLVDEKVGITVTEGWSGLMLADMKLGKLAHNPASTRKPKKIKRMAGPMSLAILGAK